MQVKFGHPTKAHCVLPVYQQMSESVFMITKAIKQNKKDKLAPNTDHQHNSGWTDTASIIHIFPTHLGNIVIKFEQLKLFSRPWQVQWTVFQSIWLFIHYTEPGVISFKADKYTDVPRMIIIKVSSSSKAWIHKHMSSMVGVCHVCTAGAAPLKCHQSRNIKNKHTHAWRSTVKYTPMCTNIPWSF